MKTFQIRMDNGAALKTVEAKGRDIWEALKSLGYGRNAMLYLVHDYKIIG